MIQAYNSMNITKIFDIEKYSFEVLKECESVFSSYKLTIPRLARPLVYIPILKNDSEVISKLFFQVDGDVIQFYNGHLSIECLLELHTFAKVEYADVILTKFSSINNFNIKIGRTLSDTLFLGDEGSNFQLLCVDPYKLRNYSERSGKSVKECLEELKCNIDAYSDTDLDNDMCKAAIEMMNRCLFNSVLNREDGVEAFSYEDHFKHYADYVSSPYHILSYSLFRLVKAMLNINLYCNREKMREVLHAFRYATHEITDDFVNNITQGVKRKIDSARHFDNIIDNPYI